MPDITPTMEKQRLLSLDFFRGVTVMAMIMVNNPGDGEHVYGILEHSLWNGCTPADLIFPFFLFIMGVSIPYAMERKKQIVPCSRLMLQVTRRSLILFALGIFLSLFPDFIFNTVRIPGILSRIGVVYFFCAWLYIRNSPGWQLWIFNFLLLTYYFLMVLVPVPGVGYPNTNPGTNLAAWLDRLIITDAHLYKPYSPYNPAELLTTLTAVATGISGMVTGAWLRNKNRTEGMKAVYLAASGFAFVIAGTLWGWYFPVNKLLWTSSFVLYSSGWAMLCLAVSYWLIDVQGYKKLIKPFVVYGVNAITVFFLSVLIKRIARMIHVRGKDSVSNGWDYLYQTFFEPFFNPYTASLAFAIVLVAGWMAVLWWMYNKRIIVKI